MPTYEYECPRCGVFEKFQSMKEKPLPRCPTCKSRVRRLIGTGAGLLFKGNGFYQTDYRSESYKKAASSDSAPAAPDKPAADKPAKKEPAKAVAG